ncbi:hypothetical protein VPNG_05314 [Cytospora leucostoma]|uniref:Xylanolytic transcriptional activator regulatory domain-containing protein n=1 Tax=Cytospora leucostoma TaxID=1230097 RepID=A0A423X5G7_9PEZI|nr:hypothetical protein VPNG_05314 [Cytospora leucostoma]
MALVRKLVPEEDSPDAEDIHLPVELEAEVRKRLDVMLGRPIIDFLVRYFVATVNWITSVAEVEFAILVLRICYYASSYYTFDSVMGVPLADIRKSCEEVISTLGPICMRLDSRGSLVRVQHIAFAGLACISVGRMNAFWEHISCATRVAQQIVLHMDTSSWPNEMNEIEKEMRRRTFCNLYIWDSCLSKRLHRIPFLPDDGLSADIMPQMRLLPGIDIGADAPDDFTERILRARLARFWRHHSPPPRGSGSGSEPNYDAVAAEERYETFCRTFLPTVPPAFALYRPDKQWDERLPNLPMQRHMLHMAIFEFLCWNFGPSLLQQPEHIGRLPEYKRVLLAHGKRALAAAALGLLESVSALHALMGGSHTRFSGIIMSNFEGAVPLLCLCVDLSFPEGGRGPEREVNMMRAAGGQAQSSQPLPVGTERQMTDLLRAKLDTVTRSECMRAARSALETLQTLAGVSEMAEVGARTLARLSGKVDGVRSSPPAEWPAQHVHGAVEPSNVGVGGVHGDDGSGDVAMQRQQGTNQAVRQWAFNPYMGSFAGALEGCSPSHANFTSSNDNDTGMTAGGEEDGGAAAPNWEDVLRGITDSFGFEEFTNTHNELSLDL